MKNNKTYNDYELLALLEENGLDTNFKNLELLKKGIANGTIIIAEDDKPTYTVDEVLDLLEASGYETTYENAKILSRGISIGSYKVVIDEATQKKTVEQVDEDAEELASKEAPVEEAGAEEIEEEPAARVTITMPVDGSLTIEDQNKSVQVDSEGNAQVALQEKCNKTKTVKKKICSEQTEFILHSYLIEDCGMKEKEYELLTEDTKTESVKEMAITLLQSIEEKLSSIDTAFADKSRGDISQLRELPAIQDTISKLEAVIERDGNALPEYSNAITTIIRSMLYINQYSSYFKEAYRNKKTLVILKYQSLILSIVASITYLLSTIIDYTNNDIKIKLNTSFDSSFAPLVSLKTFNNSVETGEFKKIISDITVLREYYLEVPVSTMSNILEAGDYLAMIVDGVRNIYNSLGDSNKLTNLIYKATGVVVLLFSLRDVFYTVFRMKSKVSDMLGNIQLFANLGSGGNILGKLSQFSSKFKNDAEYSSDMTKREIEDENKKLASQVKQIQYKAPKPEPVEVKAEPEVVSPIKTTSITTSTATPKPIDNVFGFDF